MNGALVLLFTGFKNLVNLMNQEHLLKELTSMNPRIIGLKALGPTKLS
jgi:hypothetical protein